MNTYIKFTLDAGLVDENFTFSYTLIYFYINYYCCYFLLLSLALPGTGTCIVVYINDEIINTKIKRISLL